MSPVAASLDAGFSPIVAFRVALAAGPFGAGVDLADEEALGFLVDAFGEFDAEAPDAIDFSTALVLLFEALGRSSVSVELTGSPPWDQIIVADFRADGLWAVLQVDGTGENGWIVVDPPGLELSDLFDIGADLLEPS